MVRKRVIGTFFGLIFLAGAIFFIQSTNYNQVTGFSVSGSRVGVVNEQILSGSGEDYSFKITDYYLEGNLLKIDYYAEDNVGKRHELEVKYLVHDSAGRSIQSGQSNVILGENQKMQYSLSIVISEDLPNDAYLTLYSFDGNTEKRALIPLSMGEGVITGNAVSNYDSLRTNSTIFFVLMVMALLFIFYCIKFIESRKLRMQTLNSRSDDRFIRV